MTFDLTEIEGRIASAIYDACASSDPVEGLAGFCNKNGISEQGFFDFLQHGIDAMTAFRLMDKYYSEHNSYLEERDIRVISE